MAPEVARVYGIFSLLVDLARARFGGEMGGKLLLYAPLDADGASVALAGNIAGMATLGVDGDGERLRFGIRQGFCDFLVNNLDEALRILKNEVRKKQPVSVCLEGDFDEVLREIVERGVQPDLLAFASQTDQAAPLVERCAIWLDLRLDADEHSSLDEVTWTAASAPALWLPKVDAFAIEVLPPGDERIRWLKLAPRYLGRAISSRRYLRMTPSEVERFTALVTQALASGAIGTEISVMR